MPKSGEYLKHISCRFRYETGTDTATEITTVQLNETAHHYVCELPEMLLFNTFNNRPDLCVEGQYQVSLVYVMPNNSHINHTLANSTIRLIDCRTGKLADNCTDVVKSSDYCKKPDSVTAPSTMPNIVTTISEKPDSVTTTDTAGIVLILICSTMGPVIVFAVFTGGVMLCARLRQDNAIKVKVKSARTKYQSVINLQKGRARHKCCIL